MKCDDGTRTQNYWDTLSIDLDAETFTTSSRAYAFADCGLDSDATLAFRIHAVPISWSLLTHGFYEYEMLVDQR